LGLGFGSKSASGRIQFRVFGSASRPCSALDPVPHLVPHMFLDPVPHPVPHTVPHKYPVPHPDLLPHLALHRVLHLNPVLHLDPEPEVELDPFLVRILELDLLPDSDQNNFSAKFFLSHFLCSFLHPDKYVFIFL
jgi:hypothetical protein